MKMNTSTMLAALKACKVSMDLRKAREIHAILHTGDNIHTMDMYISSNLISTYAKCRSMPDAQQVFETTPYRDVVSWNALTLGYAENGEEHFALELFWRCPQHDSSSFLAAIKACSCLATKEQGKFKVATLLRVISKIHTFAAKCGLDSDIFVASMLVDTYSKCGQLPNAQRIFKSMQERDVVTWTALLMGYAENGEGKQALNLFCYMLQEGVLPNARSFVSIFKACTSLATQEESSQVDGSLIKLIPLEKGMQMHSMLITSGLSSDIFGCNSLVDMYGKCGSLADAIHVFCEMKFHTTVSWNTLMMGFIENGEPEIALNIFHEMSFIKNSLTFVAALKACSKLKAEDDGVLVHQEAVKRGFHTEVLVSSTLVDMYMKFGRVSEAKRIFDGILRPTVVSWTVLMLGYVENGHGQLALDVFSRMKIHEQPDALSFVMALKACSSLAAEGSRTAIVIHDEAVKFGFDKQVFVANSIMDMYIKCGSLPMAKVVFDGIISPSIVSWNTLMLGYAEYGEEYSAFKLFCHMQIEGFIPNASTFVAAIKACTNSALKEQEKQVQGKLIKLISLDKGMSRHSQAIRSGYEHDLYLTNTLVDMYSKCGSMLDARLAFDKMSLGVEALTGLLLGYVENGEGSLALELFMECLPSVFDDVDARLFVAALKACACVAALKIGKAVYTYVLKRGSEEDVLLVNSVIDFYAKCSSMVECRLLFDSISPELAAWNSLLGGYSRLGNVKYVLELWERMKKEKEPDNVTFVVLLTACSHAGLVREGKEYFGEMLTTYGVVPSVEHYVCMVDMLGRANELSAAIDMLKNMPQEYTPFAWKILLNASCKWNNVDVAAVAFESLMKIDRTDPAPYVLMASLS